MLPIGRSLDIDVKSLGVDFAAGRMLKYLLGTAGIAFLYSGLIHSVPRAHEQRLVRTAELQRWTLRQPPRAQCAPIEAGHTGVVMPTPPRRAQVLLAVGTPAIEA